MSAESEARIETMASVMGKNPSLSGLRFGDNLKRMKSNYILIVPLFLAVALVACQPMRNFTTYYNRFYNMERIMGEVEDELLYIREQKTPQPTYYIAYDDDGLKGTHIYNHLERRSMTADEAKANKIKLDSILIKGSMLLVRNAKSDYVPDAVFYIGKTYFYQRDWYLGQKKFEELIANFPDSRWLPDAHLFLAMSMLEQGDVAGAKTMLSRAIDIAWGRERRDVLIEAFRLNADIFLAEGDAEKALQPYKRAMLLSSDDEDKARWQYEIGLVFFRASDFESALREFDLVDEYSPDILTQFQTGLQRAVTLRTLGKYDMAEQQLDELRSNGNFEEWWKMVDLERVNLASARPGESTMTEQERKTLLDSSGYGHYAIYEQGVRAFRAGDYETAYQNFQKVQSAQAPFQRRALRYAALLSEYRNQLARVRSMTVVPLDPYPDSTKSAVADAYYNVARVFSTLDIPDSLRHYYDLSSQWAPEGSLEAARAIYARSSMARQTGRIAEADSLLEILVQRYQLSEYAADARIRLGYTDAQVIDTARDLYTSGVRFMNVGEYSNALPRFRRVVDEYDESPYAPRALYAIGLMYEQHLNNYDSAFSYYSQILSRYPTSEQAAEVKPIIEAVLADRAKHPQTAPQDGAPADSTQPGAEGGPQTFKLNSDGLVPLDQADGGVKSGALTPPPTDAVELPVDRGTETDQNPRDRRRRPGNSGNPN